MAHQQNHPYHLVDPSPMPLLMSFSIMAMLVGVAMSFHQHDLGFYVLGAGLIAVLTCCFYWWRDVIAEGILQAYEKVKLDIPLIVRLAGTNVEIGRKMLEDSHLPIITADDLDDAAVRSVASA